MRYGFYMDKKVIRKIMDATGFSMFTCIDLLYRYRNDECLCDDKEENKRLLAIFNVVLKPKGGDYDDE